MAEIYQATCTAPVNIAVIKYWGKRDTGLILPTNSSLSVTLNQDDLASRTTVACSPEFSTDRIWLNGVEDVVPATGRTANCLRELRAARKAMEDKDSSLPKLSDMKIHIVSINNFPTAAGLASSASGFAALTFTISRLYQLDLSHSQLSRIARQGSGSACRSLFGGFVAWEMGSQADGSDSLAVQVAPKEHWPDLHAIICVVSAAKKGVSSSSGMQRTVENATLLQHRIASVVPERMKAISQAILSKDFDTFAQITMQDSNSFHAVCLDTYPPIFYMNDTSRAIVALVHEINRAAQAEFGHLIAAYTFDAGPNAVIYVQQAYADLVESLVLQHFPVSGRAIPTPTATLTTFNPNAVPDSEAGAVKNIIHTTVGDGPRELQQGESLVGIDGLPEQLANTA